MHVFNRTRLCSLEACHLPSGQLFGNASLNTNRIRDYIKSMTVKKVLLGKNLGSNLSFDEHIRSNISSISYS